MSERWEDIVEYISPQYFEDDEIFEMKQILDTLSQKQFNTLEYLVKESYATGKEE